MTFKWAARVAVMLISIGGIASMSNADAADDGSCVGLDNLGGINNAPLALDDEVWVAPGESVVIDVLVNDKDFDGDTLTIESVARPGSGTATESNGSITYSPGLNFEGDDTFTYVVSDAKCGADQAQVRVQVSTTPPPPDREPPSVPIITVPEYTG